MRVEQIIQVKQPEVHKQLFIKKKHRRRRRHDSQFSFRNIDRLMRERSDIDERKCR